MTETSDLPTQAFIILIGIITGAGVVFFILTCVGRWKRSSTNRQNEQNDGYQEVRDTDKRSLFERPFKMKKLFANGTAGSQQLDSMPDAKSIPRTRFCQFPSTPLPNLPSTSALSATAVIGQGTLTRESSTSELYASVDRNPNATIVSNKKILPTDSKENGKAENSGEHMYSKIRPPPGTYDEIDDVDGHVIKRPPTSIRSHAPTDSDYDPFYSQVERPRPHSSVHGPPPIPIGPLRKSSHPYDYPQFVNGDGQDRWRSSASADSHIFRKAPNNSQRMEFGPDSFTGTNGEAVYSKIDSQYGGSEDPYSSIRSSEEHYSSVLPNQLDGGNGNDENNQNGPSFATPALLRGPNGVSCAYGFIRPRSLRVDYPRRSRSDGEEYSVVTKSSERGKNGPPPIPEKRYSLTPFSNISPSGGYGAVQEPSTFPGANYNHGRDVPSTSSDRASFPGQNSTTNSDNGKREPSYRFITVRESLDALRARMEAAANNPSASTPTAGNLARSESSLHYYATISEHSYEAVPSRRSSTRNARNDDHESCRAVSYIDDDDDDADGLPAPAPLLNLSPNSSKIDSDASSSTMLNVSTDSQCGSSSSHVTLVHIGGLQNTSSGNRLEPDLSLAASNLRRNVNKNHSPSQRETNETFCPSKSEDALDSTSAALSIDVEKLLNVDGRDFNASVVEEFDPGDVGSDTAEKNILWPDANRNHSHLKPISHSSPAGKGPEIVDLEKLENFNVSSSNSLNEEELTGGTSTNHSEQISYQL